MSDLEPLDNGPRPYRPGLVILLSIPLLLSGGWIIFEKVREKQERTGELEESGDLAENSTVAEEIREIREAPKPPSIHPLAGKRRLFLADGCRYRYQEFTFTRNFSEQHDHPGVVIRDDDPCLWNFVGVPDQPDLYRIFCADPRFPEFHDHNLTYTRAVDDNLPLDDHPPYLTLRSDDYCEWQVRKLEPANQYELYCRSGAPPFLDESLGWMTEQEGLTRDLVTATLGKNGDPSWWILPEGESPELPRRATHLIVMPKDDLSDLAEAREDFEEEGHGIFRVEIRTADDEFLRAAEDLDTVALVKALQNSDPIIAHPDFPSIFGTTLEALLENSALPSESDAFFPLIIPLKIALRPHLIRELRLENTEFWINEWEELEDFQSHLDESDTADGRVYHGEHFTYLFVSWDP